MNLSKGMMGKLQGTIVNFRTGSKTQRSKECIIQFAGIKTAGEASKLIGRKISWSPGKRKTRGKIVSLHGKHGLVRARFRKGLPGQLGTLVEIIG